MTKSENNQPLTTRRTFLSAALAAPVLIAGIPVFERDSFAASVSSVLPSSAASDISLVSPNRLLQFHLIVGERELTYKIAFRKQPVIELSRITG
jgi:hypothetical protein